MDLRLRVRGRLGCALGSHHSGAAQSRVGLLAQAGRGVPPCSPVSVTCRAGWSLARSVSGWRHLAPADIHARGLPRKGQLGPALAHRTELCALQWAGVGGTPGQDRKGRGRPQAS